jgi:alkylation response protein AidB-like acyl-CoA dehydrogenase
MSIYSEEHHIFKTSIRKFVEKEILPKVDSWEAKCSFPTSIFKKLGEQGFLGILIEEKWGGVAKDYSYAAAWCEEFGKVPAVGFTTGVNMHSLVVTPTLQRFGSEEAKNKWLTLAVEGKAVGAYAFTEPGAGSDLSRISTSATLQDDYFVINGSKIFITNGKKADFILVLTKTDPSAGFDGFTTFIVDTKLPGFSVSKSLEKLGWHSSDTVELVFENVKVPRSAVLGSVGKGWQQAMSSLEWERLMLSLGALGGAEACVEDTVTYVKDRSVFGAPLADFEITQSKIINSKARLGAFRSLCHECVELLLNKDQKSRLQVSLAKLGTCQAAIEIADDCLQLHGGYGYTTEFRPERWLRDLRLNTIGGGTNEIMARIAIKELRKS